MWTPDPKKLVKICLHASGEDVETPWAEDLGPAADPPGARFVRIGNVPFLHPKPTYGDVILVEPDETGRLTWDRQGVEFEHIGSRLVEDMGRWLMIIDYELTSKKVDATTAFRQLDRVGTAADIVVEGCFEPRPGRPGRAYLAVPGDRDVEDVLDELEAARLPLRLTLVHPLHENSELHH